jgi:hypothetical protein
LSGRLTILAPLAMLVGVVVVAGGGRLLGRPDAAPPAVAPIASHVAPPAEVGPEQAAATPLLPTVMQPVPAYAFDLDVHSVSDLLADRAAGLIQGELVAVSGLLAYDQSRAAVCSQAVRGPYFVFCQRHGILTTASPSSDALRRRLGFGPRSSRGDDGGPAAGLPRVSIRIPVGIPMPSLSTVAPQADPAVESLTSVLIGRFVSASAPSCPAGARACRDEFILERLAWTSGAWVDRILVRDPSLPESVISSAGRRPQAIATREADRLEQILSLAVLTPAWLDTIDAVIGQAAARGAQAAALPAGPVWYLRSAGREQTSLGRALTWAVIDHESGFVLATGAVEPD